MAANELFWYVDSLNKWDVCLQSAWNLMGDLSSVGWTELVVSCLVFHQRLNLALSLML